MGAIVQWSVDRSIDALNNLDAGLANDVIANIEPQVNNLHRDIDAFILDILATQHPLAVDLRFVTSAARVNGDLERIGDRAVNIAHRAISLSLHLPSPPVVEIPNMAEKAQAMVRD